MDAKHHRFAKIHTGKCGFWLVFLLILACFSFVFAVFSGFGHTNPFGFLKPDWMMHSRKFLSLSRLS
jgi:hypothetical protein